jgi:hypothetical protein
MIALAAPSRPIVKQMSKRASTYARRVYAVSTSKKVISGMMKLKLDMFVPPLSMFCYEGGALMPFAIISPLGQKVKQQKPYVTKVFENPREGR